MLSTEHNRGMLCAKIEFACAEFQLAYTTSPVLFPS